jgi:hypothetical protein
MRFGSRPRVAAGAAEEEEEVEGVAVKAVTRGNLRHRARGSLRRRKGKVTPKDSPRRRVRANRLRQVNPKDNSLRKDRASLKDNLLRKESRPRTQGVQRHRPVSKAVRPRPLRRRANRPPDR